MKRILYIVIVLIVCVSSCNNHKHVEKDIYRVLDYRVYSYKYCSQETSFDDEQFGNIRLRITPNRNFLKCTAINDSEFAFSCGRQQKEVVLFNTKCKLRSGLNFDEVSLPSLKYDDDVVIILYLKGGSNNWINYFVYLPEDTVYSAEALYIDTLSLRYVYLDCHDYKNGNVLFVVHDIIHNTYDSIKSNYYKYRKDGYPALHIGDVSIADNQLLYYSVYCEKGEVKKDSLLLLQ